MNSKYTFLKHSKKMAAKTKTFASVGMKGMMKPVISTDVMGNRNVEIRPVGAWVQPATEQMINSHPNAIVSNIISISEQVRSCFDVNGKWKLVKCICLKK